MSTDPPDNVVSIDTARGDRREDERLFTVERAQACIHAYLVDQSSRTITCSKCDAAFDPFDVVSDLAGRYGRYATSLDRIREMSTEADSRLEELLRKERNAKARVRRLKTKEDGLRRRVMVDERGDG